MSITVDKIIPVATAVVQNAEGKVLLLQRSAVSSFEDHWQFVEGKLEESEKVDAALKREIMEELNVSVTDMQINTVFHVHNERAGKHFLAFRIVFNVTLSSDEITLSDEHKAFGWFTKKEALALPLVPGVSEVIEALL